MPQIEPIYEEVPEFLQIADKVIELHPERFGNIDVSKIACVSIQNKERSDKKSQLWDVKPIKPPTTLFCSKEYIFIIYQQDWDALSAIHRQLLVADCLCSIPPGGGGAITPMDYKDHAIMLRTFGVDYMDRSDVPDILSAKIDWKK